MTDALELLLEQARNIRPDISYVIQENYAGNWHAKSQFWAHSPSEAWCGETIDALLLDLRESINTAPRSERLAANRRLAEVLGTHDEIVATMEPLTNADVLSRDGAICLGKDPDDVYVEVA